MLTGLLALIVVLLIVWPAQTQTQRRIDAAVSRRDGTDLMGNAIIALLLIVIAGVLIVGGAGALFVGMWELDQAGVTPADLMR